MKRVEGGGGGGGREGSLGASGFRVGSFRDSLTFSVKLEGAVLVPA